MKRISLTQGKEALVSDCDHKYLMQWKWYYRRHNKGKGGYAVRQPGKTAILMHSVVAARKGTIGEVDHKDQNKLNNQRGNLRPATRSQNMANRGCDRNNTSGYKGVSWFAATQRWRAYIRPNGKQRHLGFFPGTLAGKKAAARAYNKAALAYYGKFAYLNRV